MSEIKTTRDQFFEWLKPQVTSAQLTELYLIYVDIEKFCLRRNVIKNKLFEVSRLKDIQNVANIVESNRVFRYTHKGSLSKMRMAMQFYLCFAKDHSELWDNSTITLRKNDIQSDNIISERSLENQEVTSSHQIRDNTEHKLVVQTISADLEQNQAETVPLSIHELDFHDIQSLDRTKPVELSYKSIGNAKIGSWKQLYALVVNYLYSDFHGVLSGYINRSIDGSDYIDFADKYGAEQMTAPKQLRQSLYLETNISATDVARKIKKLMDLCHVAYESLKIYYIANESDTAMAPNNVSSDETKNKEPNVRINIRHISAKGDFSSWMKQVGLSYGTINSYLSAIKVIDEIANSDGIYNGSILSIEDVNLVRSIVEKLLGNATFQKMNFRQRNRFSTALDQLISYWSSSSNLEKSTIPNPTEATINPNNIIINQVKSKEPEACNNETKSGSTEENFSRWMKQVGLSYGTINSYLSAIKAIDEIANSDGVYSGSILSIEDISSLRCTVGKLLGNTAFQKMNFQERNGFGTALAKLIRYRSSSSGSSISTTSTMPNPTVSIANEISSDVYPKPNGTKEIKHHREIPEEALLRYKAILEENFSDDGYQPGRAIFRGRVKRFYAEKFGSELTEDDERIDEIMKTVGTERDGRVYPKQDEAQSGIVKAITDDIAFAFESGATAVYTEAVYEKYKQQLADELHIYSQDSIAELLPDNLPWKYDAHRGIIFKKMITADSRDDLLRIMKLSHTPQSYDSICKKAWYLPPAKVKNILTNTVSIVNVSQGTYFYAPNLPVSENELEELSMHINEELSYHSYLTEKGLMQMIKDKCPAIATNTAEFTAHGLRNCLGYLLGRKFSFRGSVITLWGKELNAADVYSEFVRERETLTVSDLSELNSETGVPVYWSAVLNEAVRVSSSGFVRKDQIRFDVEAADNALDDICPADYIPLRDVNLFLYFPNVGYPWNTYLLESYLLGYSRKFSLMRSSFAENGTIGAVVRKSSDIKDYRSLLVDVLSKSDALTSSQAALQYIVDNGYQLRRTYKDIDAVLREARQLKEQREKQEK